MRHSKIVARLRERYFDYPAVLDNYPSSVQTIAGMYDWEAWDRRAKAIAPVKYFFLFTLVDGVYWRSRAMYRKLVHSPYYWLLYRLHPRHKYHLVDTGLPPNYYDTDTRMLHACFNLLVYYVDQELAAMSDTGRGLDHLAWEKTLTYGGGDEPTGQALAACEIEDLYLWWTEDRPARKDPYDLPNEECWALEERYIDEDTEMLTRLMKVRGALWT